MFSLTQITRRRVITLAPAAVVVEAEFDADDIFALAAAVGVLTQRTTPVAA